MTMVLSDEISDGEINKSFQEMVDSIPEGYVDFDLENFEEMEW